MKELDDWLIQDERRTAIIGRAKQDGKKQFCCILHDFITWQLPPKDWPLEFINGSPKTYPVQKICYADTFEAAVMGAIRQ